MQQEKNAIKETISKMIEDKDRELSSLAQSTLEALK
jgi:vesicle coat complex subunit